MFLDDGVFCTNLSGFTTRAPALAAGFRWVAPVLLHDPAANGNLNELVVNGSAYRREGWLLCGWSTYGQAATPERDAADAAALVRHLSLDGWIANGELWAEGENRDFSSRFITQWKAAGSPCQLAVSCLSSDTDQYVRDFDYQAWLRFGSVIMPQVYGNQYPTYTVEACLGMLRKAGVPQNALNLTFGTYSTPIPFTNYQGWHGPRSVYVGDQTPQTAWPLLGRAAARPDTPPEEKPVPPVPKPPLSVGRVPYTGPYALATNTNGYPSKGPTCEAMKRALSRAGAPSLPWRDFDQHYNQDLEDAWDWYDRLLNLQGNNGYGQGRWDRLRRMPADIDGPHALEYALDTYGQTLIQDEAGQTNDGDRMKLFQEKLTAAVQVGLAHASRWRYNMKIRPVDLPINPAAPTGTSDCSGSIIQLTDRAARDAGLQGQVADPSKNGWSGYGNTDRFMADWPHVSAPFRVGDIAHFTRARHVILCYQPGDHHSAKWWSFGHEPPESLTLDTYSRFPSEYLFTVRPVYLEET